MQHVDHDQYFDWGDAEGAAIGNPSSAHRTARGRHVECIVACWDSGAEKKRLLSSVTQIHNSQFPKHGVVVRSRSLLERVVLFFGSSQSEDVLFLLSDGAGEARNLDIEGILPQVRNGGPPEVVRFFSVAIKRQDGCVPELSARIHGKVEVLRLASDGTQARDLYEDYLLTLPAL